MKALKKSTLREIRSSIGRFIAIFAICALGVGFFSGLSITQASMLKTGNEYIKTHSMYDFKLLSTIGFSEGCEEKLLCEDGIAYAEGAHERDALMTFEGNDSAAAVKSITENINTPSVTHGRLPLTSDECIADGRWFNEDDIGKKLKLSEANDSDTLSAFSAREFTVVGIANSVCYLNYERGSTTIGNGSLGYFVYVNSSAFDEDCYSAVYVKLSGDEFIYSDEYDEKVDSYKDNLESLGEELAEDRLNSIAKKAAEDAGVSAVPDAVDSIRDSLGTANVFILSRNENIGYVCYENDSAIVAGISKVFPVFFFLVAALVCSTTMTRMVEEERTQIGTLKALGFSSGAVAAKYMFYSGSAAVSGAVIGYFIGCNVFPAVIWKVYGIMYGFADIMIAYSLPLFIISMCVALLCSAGTAYVACRRSLILRPAELIRPKSPKNGKRIIFERITFLWNRLGFLTKVSFRNIFRYKSRMIMMILGVGGCSALLVTGFGINDSIKNIVDFQFDDIMTYSYSVTFSEDMTEHEAEFISKYSDSIDDALFLHSVDTEIKSDTLSDSATLIAADGDVSKFIDLHSGKNEISYPEKGSAVLSNALAEKLGVSIGDTVTLTDSEQREVVLEISGICDNYVYDYVYVSVSSLGDPWNTDASKKTAYIICPDAPHESAAAVAADDNVLSVRINDDLRDNVSRMMSSLNYIIILLSACAAALAFIVIYNLTNINITERLREISTIKVLGFRRGEIYAYVFRENFSLSLAGAAAGLIMGCALHAYVMSCIKVDMVSFDTRIAPLSFLISFVMTLVFAAAVNFAMFKKLDGINMAESLKSADG